MKNYIATLVLLYCSLFSTTGFTQTVADTNDYPRSKVSYTDFEDLMAEVKDIRAERLISYKQLKAFQAETNTVLLDARSRDRFESRHLKGAINLPYTDFTEENLRKLIPDVNTRILIYCNNNFEGDNTDFASKSIVFDIRSLRKIMIFPPGTSEKVKRKYLRKKKRKRRKREREIQKSKASEEKEIMLALNVPTYITLHGYGYRNIYELDELLDVRSIRLDFEGLRSVNQLSYKPTVRRVN